MSLQLGVQISYLVLSTTLTLWVGQTLFKHGRPFLVDAFVGDTTLAEAVNHLLLVGFYLVNIGYVALMLAGGRVPESLPDALGVLSTKIGGVAVVLGLVHFGNLFLITKFRGSRFARDIAGAREGQPVAGAA